MLGMYDMTITDREQLECGHNPPLYRDRLHRASVHVCCSSRLRHTTRFSLNKVTLFASQFRSMPLINTRT